MKLWIVSWFGSDVGGYLVEVAVIANTENEAIHLAADDRDLSVRTVEKCEAIPFDILPRVILSKDNRP